MAPSWLTALAWVYLSVCFASAAVIGYDIAFNHRRQPMGVMNLVFPITALYFGPLALAFYRRWGRGPRRPVSAEAGRTEMTAPRMVMTSVGGSARRPGDPHNGDRNVDNSEPPGGDHPVPAAPSNRPRWVQMATEVSHCGSGCTVGDIISELIIFALALTVAGRTLWAEYIGDYTLAVLFGIVFQYFAIAPMRGLGVKDGLQAAAKADVVSLTAFEIGLFGWMALMAYVFFPAPHQLTPSAAAFWFLMQIGMMIGYFTSWPANVWLVNRGIKSPM